MISDENEAQSKRSMDLSVSDIQVSEAHRKAVMEMVKDGKLTVEDALLEVKRGPRASE